MVELTLVYEDASTWFAGGFPSLAAANAWLDIEKTRPYWKNSTVANIVEVPTGNIRE